MSLNTTDCVARRTCSSVASIGFSARRRRRPFISTSPSCRDGVLDPDADLSVPIANGHWTLERGDFSRRVGLRALGAGGFGRRSIRTRLIPFCASSIRCSCRARAASCSTRRASCATAAPSCSPDRRAPAKPPSSVLAPARRDGADRRNLLRPANRSRILAHSARRSRETGSDAGESVSAPVAALFRLEQGPDNQQTASWPRRRPCGR